MLHGFWDDFLLEQPRKVFLHIFGRLHALRQRLVERTKLPLMLSLFITEAQQGLTILINRLEFLFDLPGAEYADIVADIQKRIVVSHGFSSLPYRTGEHGQPYKRDRVILPDHQWGIEINKLCFVQERAV